MYPLFTDATFAAATAARCLIAEAEPAINTAATAGLAAARVWSDGGAIGTRQRHHGHHATRCLRNWWVCSFRSSFRLLAREQVLVWNPREFLKPRVKGHLSVDKLFLTCGDTSKPVSSNWHLFSVRHGRRSAVAHPGTEINVVQMRTHTFPAQRRSRHTGLYTEVSSRERKRSNTWSRAARVGCPGSSMRCSVTTECGGIGEPGRADSPGSSIAMNASPSSSRRN